MVRDGGISPEKALALEEAPDSVRGKSSRRHNLVPAVRSPITVESADAAARMLPSPAMGAPLGEIAQQPSYPPPCRHLNCTVKGRSVLARNAAVDVVTVGEPVAASP
jgi:hypothetical protein